MPRHTQSQPRVATPEAAAGVGPGDRLGALLAHATPPHDVLAELHRELLDLTGGGCSLLFQHNPRNGLLHATSGFGLEALPTDPWAPEAHEAALVADAFETGTPLVLADAAGLAPGVAERLDTAAVLLVPLARGADRVGVLAVGFDTAPRNHTFDIEAIADAFVAALELFHLRQRDRFQRDLVALLDAFSGSLWSTLSLTTCLQVLCDGANRL